MRYRIRLLFRLFFYIFYYREFVETFCDPNGNGPDARSAKPVHWRRVIVFLRGFRSVIFPVGIRANPGKPNYFFGVDAYGNFGYGEYM